MREQDLGAGSDRLVGLGDGDGFPIVRQLSGLVDLDWLDRARGLRQDPPERALFVEHHMTRSTVDSERASEGHLSVLETVERREVGGEVGDVTDVESGMLYELMGV